MIDVCESNKNDVKLLLTSSHVHNNNNNSFRKCSIFWCVIAFILSINGCLADEHSHKYTDNEEVVLWYNTVGPRRNQQETYKYYSLPFCRGPDQVDHHHETISERLLGIQLETSGLDIKFKQDQPTTHICTKKLNSDEANLFSFAITHDYWYEMYIDGLVWRQPVGEMLNKNSIPEIFLHKKILILYNQNRIIAINVSSTDPTPVVPNAELKFTCQIEWFRTNTSFANRFERYKDIEFFQHKIHSFSIFNSFMMVLFMVCFVYLIMSRILRHDIATYNKADDFLEMERDGLIDECGWKQIGGDIFRHPSYPMLLSIFIGSGCHLLVTAFICMIVALIGELYTERASFLSAVIVIYTILSPINGYSGGAKYCQWKGNKWISQSIFSTIFCPCLVFTITIIVSILAISNGTTRGVSFYSLVTVTSILIFVMIPLNLLGTICGRSVNGEYIPPCRLNPIPRPIPDKRWYSEPWMIALIGGLLPAGSIFIEMYFILTSFWAYKIYYVFEFTILVYLMLIILLASMSVICTYFLINSEDYRWYWTSFATGASISVYMYLFAIYYFIFKTRMYGLFQTTFFFGYMFVFCALMGILCGTTTFCAANIFIRKIYLTIKLD